MTLRPGRSPADGNRAIRRVLAQFGATSINDLREEHYAAVIAAVMLPTLADHYGVTTDVPDIKNFPDGQVIKNDNLTVTPPVMPTRSPRPFTPLVKDLAEKLAAAKAKTRRSAPSGRADLGAPAQFGDQDDSAVQDWPSGEKKS